ncbi:hypothetical protein CROQUDRAFT_96493 [Cronartium quercuum f. sp. fusiforme G11]|uniref:Uncharacterized protein n=1 Tax=Cronartium quercuum f. sp. fusiforme G11 TaxID=708437 RepID=A0A9P6NCY2_9BASI|nr:hypothetical protein CROQUDRAFT_96493 [Cronartium quercuum f. sp. fusiforme G11]
MRSESAQVSNERFGDSHMFRDLAKRGSSIAIPLQHSIFRRRLSACTLNSDPAIYSTSLQSRLTVDSYDSSTTSSDMPLDSSLSASVGISFNGDISDSAYSSSCHAFDFQDEEISNVESSLDHLFAMPSHNSLSSGVREQPNKVLSKTPFEVSIHDPLGDLGSDLDSQSIVFPIPPKRYADDAIHSDHNGCLEVTRSESLVEDHANSSGSLVFDHLKVLLSELDIPDNDSPKYHVAWAFDPPFSKPKPSSAFDTIAFEIDQIQKTRKIPGEDLEERIQKLRSPLGLGLGSGFGFGLKSFKKENWSSLVMNKKLKSFYWNFKSIPFWGIIGPVKASTLVNAINVNAWRE